MPARQRPLPSPAALASRRIFISLHSLSLFISLWLLPRLPLQSPGALSKHYGAQHVFD